MTPSFLSRGPVPLTADNFTPLARTPWGGEKIARGFKELAVPHAIGRAIGESWEFSYGPDFPSRLRDEDLSLKDLIDAYPSETLSPAQKSCDILVKLLDTAEPLSLQVHPRDDDGDLKAGECGKPESWLVLDAMPGAGIYLGFSRAVSRDELRKALLDGARARELLQFEPVLPGDYFEIEPGVPHAIGAGVTLLEPQRVVPGKIGKTYRMWDWGRRYADDGKADPAGAPRPLHLEESLRLVDPLRQVGPAFAASLRRKPRITAAAGGAEVLSFPPNPHYQTILVRAPADARFSLSVQGGYGALVVLEGGVVMSGVSLRKGEPALLPHAAMPFATRTAARTVLALVIPHGAAVTLT